jgi:hypothetical protein
VIVVPFGGMAAPLGFVALN